MALDANDPFWMFESYKYINHNNIKLPSSLGNEHTHLGLFDIHHVENALTQFGISLAVGYAVNKLFRWAENVYWKNVLIELLNYTSNQEYSLLKTIHEVTFDLALMSYPDFVLDCCAIAGKPQWGVYLEGTSNYLSKRKSPGFKDSIPNYFDTIGEVFSIYADNLFKNISINMNRLVFALITNFYKQYPQKITEEEYNRMLAYFIFTDYKKIKNLKPYRVDHPLGYVTILDLIILPNQINTVDYLESRYNTCSLIDTHLCAITFKRFKEEYWGNALLRT